MRGQVKTGKVVICVGFLVGMFMASSLPVSAGTKTETIEAQAMGTGTQLGANIGVTLNIYEYSTQGGQADSRYRVQQGPGPGVVERSSEDEGRWPR
jgi:hypothetical protein